LSGPSHPAILAEIRRAERSSARLFWLSMVLLVAVAWCLLELPTVVHGVQVVTRDHLVPMLPALN